MPDRITLDEALASTQAGPEQPPAAKKRITFDEASQALDATTVAATRPPGVPASAVSPGVPAGYERAPRTGAPRRGQPSLIVKSPLPANESRFATALKADIPIDQQTRLRVLASDLFPGDPDGINRVGFRGGRPVYVNDEGQLQYVTGRGVGAAASLVASSPEIIAGTAGALSPNPVAGSAGLATLARAGKRRLSNIIFDEPVTRGSLGKELLTEAAINAGGAALGKAGAAFADRGRVVNFAPQQLADAERTQALIKGQTGIDLDLALASGERRLLSLRDYAARYPGQSADLIQARDEALQGQFDAATQRVLNQVAQPQSALITGQTGINTAKEVIEGARQAVRAQARPLYEQAYAAVPEVTDPSLLKFLKLPYFADALRQGRTIQALDNRIEATPAFVNNPKVSLRDLDYLKRGLDQQIETLSGSQASIRRQEAAALRDAKNEFVAELDNLSNNLYQDARRAYQQGIQQTVEPLENGLVGALASLSPEQATVAAQIFTGNGVTPEGIALLRSSLEQRNPRAYRSLVRQYLDEAYDLAQKGPASAPGDAGVNAPGKFYNLLAPTPTSRDRLRAILPRDALPVFEGLLDVAQKLAPANLGANRIAGSNTYRDATISEIIKGRAVAIVRSLARPRQAITDAAELRAQEQGIIELTEALLDPAKRDQLSRIVRMKDTTKQAILLGTIFTGQSAAGEISDRGENVTPAQLQQ